MAEGIEEKVDHPSHYGGAGSTYEAVNVIEALGFNFLIGNVVKYLWRAGRKTGTYAPEDLRKALWYLEREIHNVSTCKDYYDDHYKRWEK